MNKVLKKGLIVLPVVGAFLGGYAWEKEKKANFGTPTSLYAKLPGGPCLCIILPFGTTCSHIQTSTVGLQATINSRTLGRVYFLYEDNGCVTSPVYFK